MTRELPMFDPNAGRKTGHAVRTKSFLMVDLDVLALGFKHVESGPLVRSSYHARDQVPGAELRRLRRQATVDASGRVVPLAG